LNTTSIRVLVIDDYEPWRRLLSSTLQKQPEYRVIGEASDGLQAVQQAQQLQPDLILLDIGLPTLNGIEAARRIREFSPTSKLLFVSENRSLDIVEQALSTGADGYVVKSDAASELLTAIKAVLEGEGFVSTSLSDGTSHHPHSQTGVKAPTTVVGIARRHEVAFYSDDLQLIDHVTQFIGDALKAGNAAIVVATDSHRHNLLPRLQAFGLDIGTAIQEGRYIAVDADEALSTFVVNGMPDPTRFMEACGTLILTAAKAAQGQPPRVAVYAEDVHLLWERGNPEAVIQVEQLCNKLAQLYDVDILCGYSLGSGRGRMDDYFFQQLFAEHSAVHGRELCC
jgi:DNA-binding NarL/FixJ family response regulator